LIAGNLMKQWKLSMGLLVLFLSTVGLACRLTSATPASWAGTPTAQMQATRNAAFLLTQNANVEELDLSTSTPLPEIERSSTPKPSIVHDGPWLIYPAPSGSALHAYDVDSKTILEIFLPEPIYTDDLVHGRSPDGNTLIVRAGSPLNTDELALYRIDLPSTEVTKITPLLSLTLQRKIVNQEGTRARETFQAITRPDALAWSPDGRFLAFTAALDNESSDLYVFDTLNARVERLNGLYSQNAAPYWSPSSNWLISQELGALIAEGVWRSDVVSGLRVPGYDDQNTLYLPGGENLGEVFVGWINAQNFISYSRLAEGASNLRQVNVETQGLRVIFPDLFDGAALDPDSRTLVFIVGDENAATQGITAGVYILEPESTVYRLLRAGSWDQLTWDQGGMFIVSGPQGVFALSPQGEGMFLPDERDARLSPSSNWLLAWGKGLDDDFGARLYQPPSDHPLQTIQTGIVDAVMWQPNSNAFYIQSEGQLSIVPFPGLNPVEIESGFSTESPLVLIWVESADSQ